MGECFTQRIKGQFVVGGDQDRRVFARFANAVQARVDAVCITGKPGSGPEGAKSVTD